MQALQQKLDAPLVDASTTDSLPSSRATEWPAQRHMTFAVIPSNGRDCLQECVDAISPQVDKVIIVNTSGSQLWGWPIRSTKLDQLYATGEDINISRWWNIGLEHAENWVRFQGQREKFQSVTWDVAVLNDDAIVPEGWVAAVAGNMRQHLAVAGCSGSHDVILRDPVAVPLDMRMQGFAFLLKGEHGMRADEQFTWYAGDDDLDWRTRQEGGMSMMRGFPVVHLRPNMQVTPIIQVQIAQDMQNFQDKWNRRPW